MTHEHTKKQFESRFPIKELSYERILHNKVQSDVCVLIPRGKKQFLWFTYMDVRNVCLIIDYKRNYNGSITIQNMTQCVCVFDESLSIGNGTIINGVLTTRQKTPFFTCEEILYYKGSCILHKQQEVKLAKMADLFHKNIKQDILTPKSIVVCSPFVTNNVEDAIEKIKTLDYPMFAIQFRRWKHKTPMGYYRINDDVLNNKQSSNHGQSHGDKPPEHHRGGNQPPPQRPNNKNISHTNQRVHQPYEMIFYVKADIQDDMYYHYPEKNEEQQQYDNNNQNNNQDKQKNEQENKQEKEVLYIPDFKTSVMMNKLFRTIKENDNLDYLEESDDEEEFENISSDKYVDTNKVVKIKCVYYSKFKKWKPIEVVSNEEKVVHIEEYNLWKEKSYAMQKRRHTIRNNQRYVNKNNKHYKNRRIYR